MALRMGANTHVHNNDIVWVTEKENERNGFSIWRLVKMDDLCMCVKWTAAQPKEKKSETAREKKYNSMFYGNVEPYCISLSLLLLLLFSKWHLYTIHICITQQLCLCVRRFVRNSIFVSISKESLNSNMCIKEIRLSHIHRTKDTNAKSHSYASASTCNWISFSRFTLLCLLCSLVNLQLRTRTQYNNNQMHVEHRKY